MTPATMNLIGAVLCVSMVVGFAAFSAGEAYGERNEREAWRKERDAILAQWSSRVEYLCGDLMRQNTAVLRLREEVAAKQRRVRGVLTEARRWKAVAQSLGWKRETRGEMHARQRREAGET